MKKLILIAAVGTVLTACGPQTPQPQVVYQPQQAVPAPVMVQQAPPTVVYSQPQPQVVVHDNSGANLATGILLGSMMSGGSRQTTVVHRTTVIHQPAPVIVNRNYYSRPSRSYNSFGRRRR